MAEASASLGVMVSSTYRDLRPEREKVRQVIEELGERSPVHWVGMEEFGALSSSPFETSQAFAEKADLVILIIGDTTGSLAPDRGMTFTEAELEIVLRDKIPCLAYLAPASASASPAVTALRNRVNRELTTASFLSIADLERCVRRDLESELRNYHSDAVGTELESPPYLDLETFRGRGDELARIANGLASPRGRVGLWGQRGSGKTALVHSFFERQHAQFDPIWLRVDDLFGRHPNGRQLIKVSRWMKERLLHRLIALLEQRPRGVLVFDNAQAAPRAVGWLAQRLGTRRGIFISWDQQALPACATIIHLLPRLDDDDGLAVLRAACSAEQALDEDGLAKLAVRLEHNPLMLTLAGHQIKSQPQRMPRDVLAEMASATGRLRLSGPTGAESDVVQSLLLAAYEGLMASDRFALSALAALPSRGYSVQSVRWLTACSPDAEASDLHRATQLGLLELAPVTDWRGHRHRLRSLIGDFLRHTDAFPAGAVAVSNYLRSKDALVDASIDVVIAALRQRLEGDPSDLSASSWATALLVDARPAMRAATRETIAQSSGPAREALARTIIEMTRTPMEADVAIELVDLLARLCVRETQAALEQVFVRPIVLQHGDKALSAQLALAAARGLASLAGRDVEEFLAEQLRSPRIALVESALQAAREHPKQALGVAIQALLSSPNARVRALAAEVLSSFAADQSPATADRLFELWSADPVARVREGALGSLAIRADPRVLRPLLERLDENDLGISMTACSMLRHYWQPAVAQAVLERLARVPASDFPECEVAVFFLVERRDGRVGEYVLRFAKTVSSDRDRTIAAFLAGVLGQLASDSVRAQLCDLLHAWLASADRRLALTSRQGLLSLHDSRAGEQLWAALRPEAAGNATNSFRAMVLFGLASWQPEGFDHSGLRALLHDTDPTVRAHAALVAGQVRARNLIEDLVALADDTSEVPMFSSTVARMSTEALDRIQGKRPPYESRLRLQ